MTFLQEHTCPQAAKPSALGGSSATHIPSPKTECVEAELQLAQHSLEQHRWCRVPGPNSPPRVSWGLAHGLPVTGQGHILGRTGTLQEGSVCAEQQ